MPQIMLQSPSASCLRIIQLSRLPVISSAPLRDVHTRYKGIGGTRTRLNHSKSVGLSSCTVQLKETCTERFSHISAMHATRPDHNHPLVCRLKGASLVCICCKAQIRLSSGGTNLGLQHIRYTKLEIIFPQNYEVPLQQEHGKHLKSPLRCQ